jgi:hypothetical protein
MRKFFEISLLVFSLNLANSTLTYQPSDWWSTTAQIKNDSIVFHIKVRF